MYSLIGCCAILGSAFFVIRVFGKEEDHASVLQGHNHEKDHALDSFLSSAIIDSKRSKKKSKGTWDSAMDLLKTAAYHVDARSHHLENEFNRLPNDIGGKTWVVLDRDEPSRFLRTQKAAAIDHFRSIQQSLVQYNRDIKGMENALAIDGTKAFERIEDTLSDKNPDKGANNKMARRIRSLLTGQVDPTINERWHGANLDKTEGLHRKGNYADVENCQEECAKGICLPSCIMEGHCMDVCQPDGTIEGDWKTSRGVFVQIARDGTVNWELGNAELLQGEYKNSRLSDKVIQDPEGFERSLLYLWHAGDDGPKPGQPAMYHGHTSDDNNHITWLEDDDVWERVDRSSRKFPEPDEGGGEEKEEKEEKEEEGGEGSHGRDGIQVVNNFNEEIKAVLYNVKDAVQWVPLGGVAGPGVVRIQPGETGVLKLPEGKGDAMVKIFKPGIIDKKLKKYPIVERGAIVTFTGVDGKGDGEYDEVNEKDGNEEGQKDGNEDGGYQDGNEDGKDGNEDGAKRKKNEDGPQDGNAGANNEYQD